MADKEKWEQRLAENSLTILVGIFLFAVVAALGVVGIYWHYFSNLPVKADAAPWGQFGDFFGGTLNPIFGFLSVMALLAALVIQGRELRISSQELKNSALALDKQNKAIAHQSFEQTFFSWVKNYQDMLATVRHTVTQSLASLDKKSVYVGREALWQLWLEKINFPKINDFAMDELAQDFSEKAEEKIIELYYSKAVLDLWLQLYFDNEYQLDSLFRNLYRLILWIDSQDESRINQAQKWMYVSVARAQLSWIEMVYLFYNGQTDRGLKFRRLVDKYALFDNLNFASDAAIKNLKDHPLENRGYAATAYDSRLARLALGLPESSEETLAMAEV
ncbi:MAG: putative phage abortive infection protein [Gallionella sp.]